jgi:hypothetical protein
VEQAQGQQGQQGEEQLQEALRRARNSIIDTSLTLYPPCCRGGAVLDWEACMAVKCRNCPRHFCGFCCTYHGDRQGSQAHARQCRLRRPGAAAAHGLFPAPGERQEAHRRLFTERLDQAFAEQEQQHGAGFLANLLGLMTTDLRDLGLDNGGWMPQQVGFGQWQQ